MDYGPAEDIHKMVGARPSVVILAHPVLFFQEWQANHLLTVLDTGSITN